MGDKLVNVTPTNVGGRRSLIATYGQGQGGIPERDTSYLPEIGYDAKGNAIEANNIGQISDTTGQSTDIPSTIASEREERPEGEGFIGAITSGDAMKEWLGYQMLEVANRNIRSMQSDDPDYQMSAEEKDALLHEGFSMQQLDYLGKSSSEQDKEFRLADVQEERDRQKRMQGMGGAAAGFVFSLIDPTFWVADAATEGALTPMLKNKMAYYASRVAVEGGLGAGAVYMNSVASFQEPDAFDITLGAAAGGIVGGLLGRSKRKAYLLKDADNLNPAGAGREALEEAGNLVDDHISEAADAELAKSSISKLVDEDTVQYHRAMWVALTDQMAKMRLSEKQVEHIGRLRGKITAKIKPRLKEIKRLTKEQDEVLSEIRTQKIKFKKIQYKGSKTKVKRDKLARKTEFHAWRAERLAHVEALEERIKAQHLLNKADKLREEKHLKKLRKHSEAVRAAKELEDFHKMTPDEQIEYLFKGQEKPIKREYTEGQGPLTKAAEEEDYQLAQKAQASYVERTSKEGESSAKVEVKPTPEQTFSTGKPTELDSVLDDMKDKESASWYNTPEGQKYNQEGKDSKIVWSDGTNLARSKSKAIRSLGFILCENARGFGYKKNIARLADTLHNKIMFQGGNGLTYGFWQYIKEQNLGMRHIMNTELRKQFDKDVALYMKGLKTEVPESVKLAAGSMRKMLDAGWDVAEKRGVLGFESDMRQKNYFPDILNHEAFNLEVFQRAGWSEKDAKDLIKKAYMEGENSMTDAQGNLIAELMWNGIKSRSLDVDPVRQVFSANSMKDAEALLKKAGVPEEDIQAFINDPKFNGDWATISNRAKKSFRANWDTKHTVNGKSVRWADVMHVDLNQVANSYAREMSALGAWAEHGVKSAGARDRLIDKVMEEAQKELGHTNEANEQISKSIKTIKDVVKMIEGKSVVDHTPLNRGLRVAMNFTQLVRLAKAGYAAAAEIDRTIHSCGILETLRGIKDAGILMNPVKHITKQLDHTGETPDLAEIFEAVGFRDPAVRDSLHLRTESLDDPSTASFLSKMERRTDNLQHFSRISSLHNLIQGGWERASLNTLNRSLLHDALGLKGMRPALRKELESTGIPMKEWEALQDWAKQNYVTEDVKGHKIYTWNYHKMPDKHRETLQSALHNLHNRHVQRTIAGETNTAWFGATGRLFTQFRHYQLASLEKQFIHDAQLGGAHMGGMFMHSVGTATIAYLAKVGMEGAALPEDQRETWFENAMDPLAMASGVSNMMGQTAWLGNYYDVAAATGAIPPELMQPNRYQMNTGKIENFIPAVGMANDLLKATASGVNLGYDTLRGKPEDGLERFIHSSQRALPFLNAPIVGTYIKNANKED